MAFDGLIQQLQKLRETWPRLDYFISIEYLQSGQFRAKLQYEAGYECAVIEAEFEAENLEAALDGLNIEAERLIDGYSHDL